MRTDTRHRPAETLAVTRPTPQRTVLLTAVDLCSQSRLVLILTSSTSYAELTTLVVPSVMLLKQTMRYSNRP